MAYGIIHFFPNGTKEQYDATLALVHPDKNSLPKGQLVHIAGPTKDGWTVSVVHDSKESWEKFKNETLMPKLTGGVKGGFSGPPQETAFEIYNFRQASGSAKSSESQREANI
ncbi:hypothetical protein [uncultured Bdellovibrio sp.]|uniref:hypothetical protein n=1 Tax=Bdellovibrio sp. HCB-162 TaxID=3394234 RepID=UPI0025F3A52B|nr:hypothetical protein [uncultured Bdellovibrio sp.]